jgi:hypothetical protein
MPRNLMEWWTLENWNRAGDLAAKLITVVAALTAISFFSARPDLVIEQITCRSSIHQHFLNRAYESRNLKPPNVIADLINMPNQVREARDFQQFYKSHPRETLRYSCADRRGPLSPPDTNGISKFKEKRAIALTVYSNEVSQAGYEFPGIVLDLMRTITDLRQFKFALQQVEKATYIELVVEVRNDGWGPARNMRFQPPAKFRLESPVPYEDYLRTQGYTRELVMVSPLNPIIDLGARQSAVYFIETAVGDSAIQLDYDRSSLLPEADTGAAVNLPIVVAITVVLFVGLWLPLVIRDIRRVNRETPT